MLACGEREAVVLAPFPMRDSAVSPYFHGCLAFLHRHFPPQSPPSHPRDQSLLNQQQPPPWDHSTIPKLPVPLQVYMAAARTVWSSFHLGCHRAAVSLSALYVSPLTQTIALMWDLMPASVPAPAEGRSRPTNTPGFPPSSFILLSLVWFYIFFSTVQALLSTLSWCSACTSVSEAVFLMYPWREMCSMSTDSSTTSFSCLQVVLIGSLFQQTNCKTFGGSIKGRPLNVFWL